jgi:hypothetical protein
MSAEHQADSQAADDLSDRASRHTLALNPLVCLRGKDLFDSAGILIKAMLNEPRVAIAQWLSFLGERTDIVGDKSERTSQPGISASAIRPGRVAYCTTACSRPMGRGGRKTCRAEQPERGR